MTYWTYCVKIADDVIVAWASASYKDFIIAEAKKCIARFLDNGYHNLSVEIIEKKEADR